MQRSVNSCLASLGEHDSDHDLLANDAVQEEDQQVSERDEDSSSKAMVFASFMRDLPVISGLHITMPGSPDRAREAVFGSCS